MSETGNSPWFSDSSEDPKKQYLDNRGQVRTQSLFWELKREGYTPIYNLSEYDHSNTRSLKKIYLEEMDLSEYHFANKYFYNYDHWKRIAAHNSFKKHIDSWREELEIKLRSEALLNIVNIANNKKDKSSFQASKFLSKKEWAENRVGRKKKEEKEKEQKMEAIISNSIQQDLARIKKS